MAEENIQTNAPEQDLSEILKLSLIHISEPTRRS